MPSNEFQERLRTAEGIIWDLDGTLYRFDEVLKKAFRLAAARAARHNKVPHTLDEAVALALLSLPTEKVLMVEDRQANLRIPRDMGMSTVLTHHGQPLRTIETHVDHPCANAPVFMKVLRAAKGVTPV